MSDSEGTKELSGIARSIDALFSPPAGDPVDTLDAAPEAADAEPSPTEAAEPGTDPLDFFQADPVAGPDSASDAGDSPEPEGAPFADGLTLDEDFGLAAEEGVDAPPPASTDQPGPPDLTEAEPFEPFDEPALAEPFDEPALAEPFDEPALAASFDEPGPGDLPTPAEDAREAVPAASESEPVAVADMAPTPPLEAAVEAFLGGDASQRPEIERLALELRDGRDVDAVAAAVGRMAAAAGEPPDNDILELALSMTTPLVYERLARQMGGVRDEERRKELFVACRNLGEPMARAVRDDLSDSTDRLARRVHCEALVAMGPVGRPIIEEMAVDDNRFLVRNAVAILGETGGDKAVDLVTSALANPDAKVRREALRSLAKLGDEEAGGLVVGLLEDPDPDVRIAAAVAAGELRVGRALRFLIKMLDGTSDPDEAIPLIRALGQIGDPGAVASIEKHSVPRLFSKPRTDVRIAGYRALNQMGTPHARRLLNQALDDKDPEVKSAVKDILGMR